MDPTAAKMIGAGIACIGMGVLASASAPSSATISRLHCAIPRPPKANSAT